MSKLGLLKVIMFLWPVLAMGQMNYRKGLIITNNQDTIVGLIKDCGNSRNANECLFKETRKSPLVKYTPSEISAYHMFGYKKFVSRKVFSRKEFKGQFIEVLFEGNINLYYHFKGKDVLYYAEKPGESLIGLENELFTVSTPLSDPNAYTLYRNKYDIESKVYIDTLYSMMKDQKNIANQLVELEYNANPLISVFKAYSEQTCESANCNKYEKDRRIGKDRFGIYSGLELFQVSFEEYGYTSSFFSSVPVGILYNIPLSRFNERFSLQLELNYTKYQFSSDLSDIRYFSIQSNKVSLPISLHYKFSTYKFSPIVGIGKAMGFIFGSDVSTNLIEDEFNSDLEPLIYKSHRGSWFFDIGAEYDIKPNFTVFSTIRLHQYQNKIISQENSNYSRYKNAEGVEFKTNSLSVIVGFKF